MPQLLVFYRSTIGKKVIMGVTGLIGIGFVIGHALGNLQAFQGATTINAYAAFLKSSAAVLWAVRLVLLGAVVLHVLMAFQLWARANAARPVGYAKRVPQVSTFASRTVRLGGVLLLLFIPFHILHFTTGTIRPAGVFSPADVYGNIVSGFRVVWVSVFYIVAMTALLFHLYHGAWSALRSLGLARPSPDPLARRASLGIALAVWIAFVAVPIGVLAGVIGRDVP